MILCWKRPRSENRKREDNRQEELREGTSLPVETAIWTHRIYACKAPAKNLSQLIQNSRINKLQFRLKLQHPLQHSSLHGLLAAWHNRLLFFQKE
jgi:hypothetical protein